MYCIIVCSMNELYCNKLVSSYEGTHPKIYIKSTSNKQVHRNPVI